MDVTNVGPFRPPPLTPSHSEQKSIARGQENKKANIFDDFPFILMDFCFYALMNRFKTSTINIFYVIFILRSHSTVSSLSPQNINRLGEKSGGGGETPPNHLRLAPSGNISFTTLKSKAHCQLASFVAH